MHRSVWSLRVGLTLAIVAGILLTGCSAPPSRPTVAISAPASGTQVKSGQDVSVQSTATDAKGVVRVDLLVDGQMVRSDPAPSPQTSFTVVQVWKAGAPGKHIISVQAYNKDNAVSNPAEILLEVQAAPTAAPTTAPTATPTIAPTVVPTAAPTVVRPTATPAGCTNGATFVADVTIPDGTSIKDNEAFNKVWRMRNSGTCEWKAGYNLVFVGGEAMSNVQVVAVPPTPAGGMVDLVVSMTAPTAPGAHIGRWRLRTADGVYFGDLVDVKISVPDPSPPKCAGTPVIASFAASATAVQKDALVTLSWGAVTNADRAEIVPDIGGIGTPGSLDVHVEKTTTYVLKAYCGNALTERQVTINVVAPPPAQRINLTGNWNSTSYMMELQEAVGCSKLPCGYAGRWIHITAGSPEIGTIAEGHFDGLTLSLKVSMPGFTGSAPTFVGQVSGDGNLISGAWTTGGKSESITFTRAR